MSKSVSPAELINHLELALVTAADHGRRQEHRLAAETLDAAVVLAAERRPILSCPWHERIEELVGLCNSERLRQRLCLFAQRVRDAEAQRRDLDELEAERRQVVADTLATLEEDLRWVEETKRRLQEMNLE